MAEVQRPGRPVAGQDAVGRGLTLQRRLEARAAGARLVERQDRAAGHGRRFNQCVATPSPRSPDLAAVRRALEEQRDRAREKLAGLAKTPERGTAQGFGKRIGDGTTEAISRLTDIGVGSSVETGLERTERALAKLEEGTYGICDVCGKPIEPARLAARPDSVMCLADAGAQPRARPSRR